MGLSFYNSLGIEFDRLHLDDSHYDSTWTWDVHFLEKDSLSAKVYGLP